jgi:hypothetical protein
MLVFEIPEVRAMRKRKLALLIAGVVLAGILAVPGASLAWVSVGLGIGYAGPYGPPCPPAYVLPGYYPPPAYYPPVAYYPPPAYYYYPPPVYWPGYGPEIAVRWNRYFDPRYPRIQGFTLPR